MNESAFGMLGILNRAKLVIFGPAVEDSLRKGHLLLLAEDASPRSKKTLLAKAESHGLEVYLIPTKQELGAPLGRDELTSVLITSKKAANSLLQKLSKGE